MASAVARNIVPTHRLLELLGASHQRYHDVKDAAADTYKWLIEGVDSLDKELRGDRFHAWEKFTTWLESGNGLFHIVGKPGSGKSTAMKVIARHPATRQLLSCWAGNSRLVLAKFFFWKPAGPAQNSLESFMRGILFDVLRTAPELAEVLFPLDSVNLVTGTEHSFSQIITAESVKRAFGVLTSSDAVSRTHRFCFLIDGLDEYEVHDDFMLLHHFVTQLQIWSSRPTCAVKLCVASRDLPAFRNLASEQKLWLHLYTKEDMAAFVNDRLRGDELPNGGLSLTDRTELAHALLERADGVFLWLYLVVGSILEGIYRGDSTKTLHKQVLRMPTDLGLLFADLLARIPQVHTRFAHLMLAVVMRLHGVMINQEKQVIGPSHAQPSPLKRANYRDYEECLNNFVALRSFSLLADLWDSTDAEEKGFDYSRQIPVKALGSLDIERATVQVHAMSGGLLDVVEGQAVKFTHRSIPEFLQQTLQVRTHQLQIRNADVSSALCWLMFTEMQCFEKPKVYCYAIGPPLPTLRLFMQVDGREYKLFSARFLDFLLALRLDDCIPDLACAILEKIERLLNEQWRALELIFLLKETEAGQKEQPTILNLVCYVGIHEYHAWSLSNFSPNPIVTTGELQHLIYHVGLGILYIGSSQNDRTAEAVLARLTQLPPAIPPGTDCVPDSDRLWIEAVLSFVCEGHRPHTNFWVFIKDLVQRGGYPQCYLVIEVDMHGCRLFPYSRSLFKCYHQDGKDLGLKYAERDWSDIYESNDSEAGKRASMLIPGFMNGPERIEFDNVISFFCA